jgi:hypothetical protein
MGRAGLEPATLCLKDSGRIVNYVPPVHEVYYSGVFGTCLFTASSVSVVC